MSYIQHMQQDRLECEVEEVRSRVRDLCELADRTVDNLSLVEVNDSDDIQHNVNVLMGVVTQLNNIKCEMEELENSVSGCGIEPYDVAGDR